MDALPFAELGDERLLLRAFALDDASELAAIWEDPLVRRYNNAPPATEPAARRWVQDALAKPDKGLGAQWALVDRESGRLAGRRGVRIADRSNQRAGTGAWLAPWARGRGFAPASLVLCAQYVFAHWGVERLQAECDVENAASYRSLTKAGMRHEGVLRGYLSGTSRRRDQHVFSLLASDLS